MIKKNTEFLKEVKENDKIWICEFCGESNLLYIEEEEMPKNDDMIYMLQSVAQ